MHGLVTSVTSFSGGNLLRRLDFPNRRRQAGLEPSGSIGVDHFLGSCLIKPLRGGNELLLARGDVSTAERGADLANLSAECRLDGTVPFTTVLALTQTLLGAN